MDGRRQLEKFFTSMNNEDWTTVGFKEAKARHDGGMSEMEVYDQYREIQARPMGEIAPYVAPEKVISIPSYVAPVSKVVGVLTGLLLLGKMFVVGIAAIFAWMEANQVYAVAGVLAVGAGVSVAAGIGRVGSSSGNGRDNSKREYHEHHHYHQNNNFGGAGGANQTNGK